MDSLKDKVAIVTGGSRGIGRAIVLMLASEGCHVAFNYQKSEEKAKALEKEIKALGVKGKGACVDVKDFDGVKKWIESVKKDFDGLDILVNNAGIVRDKALMLMDPKEWQEVIDTNLTGTFNMARLCIVTFLKQKSGNIVNISSVSGKIGLPRQTNYSASKGGMDTFTKSLAKEVALYNVRVNAVAPGYIETDILENFSDEDKEKLAKIIPLGRMGKPEEVAACVKFLLSEKAQYLTGQIIQMDGGLAIQ
ncbi:MAG: 3-oxoacyl-[acyl-carrier-protein] reductase [Candidatus Aceula meridiana]|nr:3-oxoacyl-[acyl-carrier-protein] reductase [Candidatus Aceula meridiana]